MTEKSLSLKQVLSAVVMIQIIPVIHFAALNESRSANAPAWLMPVISAILFIPIVLLLCFMANQTGWKSYMQINDMVFGKKIGTAVNFIYLIWAVFLTAYNIKNFSERITTALFPQTSSILFIAIMLFLCSYAIRLGLAPVMRTNSIFLVFVLFILGLSFLTLFKLIEPKNLLPIYTGDAAPIVGTSRIGLAILSYFIIAMFFVDNVKTPQGLYKKSFTAMLITIILQTLLIIIPIGIFGFSLASKMHFAFFEAVKNINIFGAIEKMDAIVVVILILADFTIIISFMFAALKLLSHISNAKEIKKCSNMLILFWALLTFALARNNFELNDIFQNIITAANILVGILLPVILFITGLIRKKFSFSKK